MGVLNTIANIPTPDLRKNKFNKSRVNCTTQDFFFMKPVYSAEVMSKEDCTIQMGAFSRLAPMVRPTYARAKMVNRAFFVPYRTIWRPWNELQGQSQFEDGSVPQSVPSIKIPMLQSLFYRPYVDGSNGLTIFDGLLVCTQGLGTLVKDCTSLSQPSIFPEATRKENVIAHLERKTDVTIYISDDDNDTVRDYLTNQCAYQPEVGDYVQINDRNYYPAFKFNLGTDAKRIYDILLNLGYNISLDIFCDCDAWTHGSSLDDDDPSIYPVESASNFYSFDERSLSAMPLLSYLKVWSDWYRFQQWSPAIDGIFVEKYFTIGANNVSTFFTEANLFTLFKFLLINQYDKDYFTCAELEPISRFDTQSVVIPDNTLNAQQENQVNNLNTEKTPAAVDPDGITRFSQFMVDGLRKLTNFMMRNKIAGGRTLDRLLVQYGIKLDAVRLQRSVYLGKYEQPLQIMDVTATSASQIDGQTQFLGDYAGKGLSQGNGVFTLKHNEEFGQILILSVIVPEVSYYQGLKREMFHLGRYDFFDPNFDNLGYQAVRPDEVLNVMHTDDNFERAWLASQVKNFNGVFGFLPRYAEYKNSDTADILSGDYRIFSAGADNLRYFNLFRELNKSTFGGEQVVQSQDFCFAQDRDQYDRIFSDTNITFDHFLTFFSFDVTSYQPASQLFDSYDFGDDDEHNRHVNMSYGGTRFV